jgi:hypothetical protein
MRGISILTFDGQWDKLLYDVAPRHLLPAVFALNE